MKKKFLVGIGLAVGVAALCGLGGCQQDKDTLVIGYTLYAPMNYEDDNGKLIGFDTEFAEKVCADLGYTPRFQKIEWDNKISELETKNIDLIWNGMTITDELKEKIAISNPYMENKQVIVMKTEAAETYKTLESVRSATSIAVESGSAGELIYTENEFSATLNKMTAQSDCLLEVKTGRSELAIIDYTMAKAMTGAGTDFSDLTFADIGFETEQYGIGMRKEDTELLNEINALITKYQSDGTLDTLLKKYFSA